MTLRKQILSLAAVACAFALFDFAIYNLFTKPCIQDRSASMAAKSIELDEYLPYDENSKAVKLESAEKLDGDLPIIDGAAALYPLCSSFIYSFYPENSAEFDGTDFTENSKLKMTNTRGAYKAVADGDVDIVICAAPSDEQVEYAEQQSADLELVPIGKEAFVFLVNGDNSVDGLTTDEIKGIYSGKITNWSQVGGDFGFINALQRNEGSGSQTSMLSFMGDTEMKKFPLGFWGRSIGFSFRYYVEDVVEDGGVKMLSVDGVYPDKESISDGSYPLASNFYAVYDKNNDNENVEKLVDLILGETGQNIIEQTGYCKVTG